MLMSMRGSLSHEAGWGPTGRSDALVPPSPPLLVRGVRRRGRRPWSTPEVAVVDALRTSRSSIGLTTRDLSTRLRGVDPAILADALCTLVASRTIVEGWIQLPTISIRLFALSPQPDSEAGTGPRHPTSSLAPGC